MRLCCFQEPLRGKGPRLPSFFPFSLFPFLVSCRNRVLVEDMVSKLLTIRLEVLYCIFWHPLPSPLCLPCCSVWLSFLIALSHWGGNSPRIDPRFPPLSPLLSFVLVVPFNASDVLGAAKSCTSSPLLMPFLSGFHYVLLRQELRHRRGIDFVEKERWFDLSHGRSPPLFFLFPLFLTFFLQKSRFPSPRGVVGRRDVVFWRVVQFRCPRDVDSFPSCPYLPWAFCCPVPFPFLVF